MSVSAPAEDPREQARRYGQAIAGVYDDLMTPAAGLTESAVRFLASFGAADALELGVGTGRIAVPLAALGVRVHGIDISASMLARLRDRPGGEAVTTSIGDIADIGVPRKFDLVYIVFNTLCALPDQDRQVACVRASAARLRPGGVFVTEAFVPDPARYAQRGGVLTRTADGQARVPVSRHDPVAQTLTGRQAFRTDGGIRVLPLRVRYVWPAELDLMARLAGLRLAHRFGGWCGEPFTADSDTHVSVYTAPPQAR